VHAIRALRTSTCIHTQPNARFTCKRALWSSARHTRTPHANMHAHTDDSPHAHSARAHAYTHSRLHDSRARGLCGQVLATRALHMKTCTHTLHEHMHPTCARHTRTPHANSARAHAYHKCRCTGLMAGTRESKPRPMGPSISSNFTCNCNLISYELVLQAHTSGISQHEIIGTH
jgi:hypothetical protein